MKSYKSLVWERSDQKTIEYCRVAYNEIITLNGYITGMVNDIPLHVEYLLKLNKSWQINSFLIKAVTDSTKSFSLTRKDDNPSKANWIDEDGKEFPEFNDCNDIDISLSPLTNTLPIKRLSLPEDKPRIIDVLYIDLLSGKLKQVKQRYTNLGNNKYLYESMDSGFKAEISINNDGFVTDYSVYWKLIKQN